MRRANLFIRRKILVGRGFASGPPKPKTLHQLKEWMGEYMKEQYADC